MSRYAFRKKDANHNEIAEAWEKLGYSVWDTSRLGDDFPDMIVAKFNINVLCEAKATEGKLSKGQLDFFTKWQGWTVVCRSVDDVLRINEIVMKEAAIRLAGFDRLSRGGLTR